MVFTRGSKRRLEEEAAAFTPQNHKYTRRNVHAQKKVQTDGNQGILTRKNVTNATVSHRVSKVELETNVEAVTLKRPGPVSVSIQRETRHQLQNDQASGVNGENPTLQHRELHMNPSQDSQQEASGEANPTAIVSARDSQSPSIAPGTKGPGELHLSSPLNACAEARNCDLIVSSVSATRGNFDGRATMSLNLTEFAAMNDEEDLSDIDSLSVDSSLVSVNGYLVKPETVALLTSVLSKYGDIGAKCSLKSTSARSFFLQKICDILDKLLSTSIGAITENEIADMRAFVSDIGNANVEVAWLQKRLDEIHEAKKAIPHLKPKSVLKLQHAERKKRLGAMKERLEAYRNEFADRQAEALELRNKIVAVQSEISVTEKEVLETDKAFSESKAQLKKVYDLGSLAKGLI